jgi:acetyl esterase
MPLDPVLEEMFKTMPQLANFQMWALTPEQARGAFKKLCQFAGPEAVPIGKVTAAEVPSETGAIKLRIYTPVAGGAEALPGIVFYHGGGFVIGDLDCYDGLCRTLANESGCRVVAVDYRLAPEHPFPAAVDDSFAALQWIEKNASSIGIDANALAVAGDSAGGNLAAVMALLAKEKGGPKIAFQLLIYPVTSLNAGTRSAQQFGAGYFLDLATVDWFRGHYVPEGTDHSDAKLSPLHAADFANLPPAYIVTAGFDPLHDEGVHYADKLKAAGVSIRHVDYPTMVHGFFSMQGWLPLAREAIAAAAQAAKEALTKA